MGFKNKLAFLHRHPGFLFRHAQLRKDMYLCRRDNKQIWLMQCDYMGHYPYLRPYVDIARTYDDVELYITYGRARDHELEHHLLKQGVPARKILHPADHVRFSRWDIYMSPTEWGNCFPQNQEALRVQLFHTLGDKGIEYGDELVNFNIIFANGPVHHDFLDKYVFSRHPSARQACKVINVGYAKIDDLFDGTYNRENLLENLGFSSSETRKVILYAPNWESSSALAKYGERVFDVLAGTGHILLIKLHYMSLISPADHQGLFIQNPDRSDVAPWKDWRTILNRYRVLDNVRVIDDQNINPYLFLADLMVTDYGGASLEFMTMNKPLVYLDCPEFFEIRGHDIFEKQARETGMITDDIASLGHTIDLALQDPEPYRSKRRELVSHLLYNPGNAARTGFRVLYDMVRQQKRRG